MIPISTAWRSTLQAALAAGMLILSASVPAHAEEGMRTLRSDGELAALLRRAKAFERRLRDTSPPPPPPAPPPAPVAEAAAQTGASADTGITNVQTAGVDEGGIVKVHGDHLVVLRRGRLFTVDIHGNALQPVDRIDAFPPGASGRGAWYDEMLIAGDTVIVVGYSYANRGTEVHRFRISNDGKLSYTDTHYLRSNDYYSSDNYASRLIGTKLIFYTPLWVGSGDGTDRLPGVMRWSADGPKTGYERLASASRTYVPDLLVNSPNAYINAFHSVTTCDLAKARLECSAVAVLGAWGRTFYVGQDAVYVWTGNLFQRRWNDRSRHDSRGIVYRIPLDGSRPGAAVVWGGPSDQFSLRSEPDGTFHALVRSGYGGDAMWLNKRDNTSAIALLSLRRSQFGRGGSAPRSRDYRPLPGGGEMSNIENRFIGNYVIYGANAYTGNRKGPMLAYAVSLDGGMATGLDVGGTVSRIDRMGGDAILIGGGNGGLRFQSVTLGPDSEPAIVDSYDLPNSGEGESRSQAFFFRPDNASGSDGMLGLPVMRRLEPREGQPGYGSGIFFMTRRDRRLSPAGQLDSAPLLSLDDGCVASCVDWYGNARPIFLRGRVFALMGYELVEGRLEGGRIGEVRRASFMPDGGGR
ncbi:MAG: beta-propeller domain-containing protein [Novosphingobium sp.]